MGLILRAVKSAYLFKRGAKAGHRAQILPGKHAYKMPYAVLFHRKAAARHQILRFGVAQRGQHISRAQHRRFRLYSRLHARPFFKISRICTAFFPSLRFIYKQAVLRKHGIYVFFTGALPAVCSLPEVCARPCLGLVAVVFEGRLKRPRHFLCHKLPFCLLICRYFSLRALNSGFFTPFSRGSRFFAKSGGKQKDSCAFGVRSPPYPAKNRKYQFPLRKGAAQQAAAIKYVSVNTVLVIFYRLLSFLFNKFIIAPAAAKCKRFLAPPYAPSYALYEASPSVCTAKRRLSDTSYAT